MRFFASVIPTIAVVAVCALGAIADGNSTASAALSDRVLPDEAYLQAILSIAFVYEASGSAICVRDYVGSLDEDIRSGREDPGMSRVSLFLHILVAIHRGRCAERMRCRASCGPLMPTY